MAFQDHFADLDRATADHLGDAVLWRPAGSGLAHELNVLPVDTAGEAMLMEGMSINTERDAWQVLLADLAPLAPGGRRLERNDTIEFKAGPRAGRAFLITGDPRVEDAEKAWLTFELAEQG